MSAWTQIWQNGGSNNVSEAAAELCASYMYSSVYELQGHTCVW